VRAVRERASSFHFAEHPATSLADSKAKQREGAFISAFSANHNPVRFRNEVIEFVAEPKHTVRLAEGANPIV
jgi:hypothetical protein